MNINLKNVENDESEFYFLIRKLTIKPYTEKYKIWDEESEMKAISKKINYQRDKIIYYDDKKIGLISWLENKEGIYLSMINILPEYQKLGIGSELLKNLIKKGKIIKLDTYENNDKTISFYKKHGFKIIGHNHNGTYPKVVMERKSNF